MYTEGTVSRPARQLGHPLDADALYDCAVRALAHRSRTEAELRRHLTPRAALPADIEAVLGRLREHGYIDDARLARAATSYQHEVFHHGRERALRDLVARGIGKAVASQAVNHDYAALDEMALLEAFLAKKRLSIPATPRQAGNLFRKLRLAGFSFQVCRRQLGVWHLPVEWLDDALDDALDAALEIAADPDI